MRPFIKFIGAKLSLYTGLRISHRDVCCKSCWQSRVGPTGRSIFTVTSKGLVRESLQAIVTPQNVVACDSGFA